VRWKLVFCMHAGINPPSHIATLAGPRGRIRGCDDRSDLLYMLSMARAVDADFISVGVGGTTWYADLKMSPQQAGVLAGRRSSRHAT
jgi:hypothetical protein